MAYKLTIILCTSRNDYAYDRRSDFTVG